MILKNEDSFRINAISEINVLRKAELKQYLQDEIYRPQMIAYFGEEEYESLRELLDTPPHFGARETEIILLPGIMGSELADSSRKKVWVNLRGLIIEGCFHLLELDSTGKDPMPSASLASIGVYKHAYFKTQVWLEKKGYTVHSFAYDWRKSIDQSANQLKVFVEEKAADQPNKQFVFVAHSMGGLVVRRYLDIFKAQAEERLEKLIMLGTPNKGSYLPLIAMKGDFPVVKIAGFRYGGAIVRKIVQSFPGLYELCPNPEIFGQPDIYDAGYWSEESINAQHLLAAQMFHQKIQAHLPEKMFLIANSSLKTITRVEREQNGNGWRYKFLGAKVGDGTVSFDSAYLREIETYKTQAEHGSI
ncbi:MAG: alpha/beta hydrolase [Rhizonema sp. PD38]|nr:alpha/beta hydrolase [Rhizonema sp. PD38]